LQPWSEFFRPKQGQEQIAEQEKADDDEGQGFHGIERST
jgi:hypothetical protein